MNKYNLWAIRGFSLANILITVINNQNYALILYDFIKGEPYKKSAIGITLGWLFCAILTGLILTYPHLVSGVMTRPETFYHIASIRTDALSGRSKPDRYEQVPVTGSKSTPIIEDTSPSQSITSITGEFSANRMRENVEEATTYSKYQPGVMENGKLANLHTALRGESYATEEIKEKYKKNLARFAKKKTIPTY